MRRAISAFLLVCFGILFPLAGSPVRLCLLENRLVIPGVAECGIKKSPCCPDCGGHRQEPCCVEWDDLPDSTVPAAAVSLPAIAAVELPSPVFSIPPAVLVEETAVAAATPIRGPDPPALRRAILEVWRL